MERRRELRRLRKEREEGSLAAGLVASTHSKTNESWGNPEGSLFKRKKKEVDEADELPTEEDTKKQSML